jgi:hypothetical protein
MYRQRTPDGGALNPVFSTVEFAAFSPWNWAEFAA